MWAAPTQKIKNSIERVGDNTLNASTTKIYFRLEFL
jgi:hypothetical protein